ncbi:C6 zinc finger domain-containing, partial [Fusarium albosuccineum]
MACLTCRARKIKCDRTMPTCLNCRLRSSHCTYAGERWKRRWTNPGPGQGWPVLRRSSNSAAQHSHGWSVETFQGLPTVSEHRDGARSQQLEQDHYIGASDADDFTNSTSSIGLDPKEAAGTNMGQSSCPVDQELTRRRGADAGEQGAESNP